MMQYGTEGSEPAGAQKLVDVLHEARCKMAKDCGAAVDLLTRLAVDMRVLDGNTDAMSSWDADYDK